MSRPTATFYDWMESRISETHSHEKVGRVSEVRGLIIESDGPDAGVGDVCEIESTVSGHRVLAEIVGFREQRLLLMPYWQTQHIHPGCRTTRVMEQRRVPAGEAMIGRIVDGMGKPIDGKGPLRTEAQVPLHRDPPNPMLREPITRPFQTGVRAMDVFTPMGEGQRMGIFAGSGVGKSTLLGMIARGAEADINVIALIGERGRELREFIEKDLGEEGLKKSVVVVSTSDQAAPLRIRAALLATSMAEYFRDAGHRVMMLMDSLTRFAMAQREIGLSIGEPPTARGYTPSLFSVLPRLLERSGMSDQGSITALYTVLVEGDDTNEPVSDTVRGILDGHLVLSRALATSNHFPAIDVLESVSRLNRSVCSDSELTLAAKARDILALYKRNEDMISIGAYANGRNAEIDYAIQKEALLKKFLQQKHSQLHDRSENWRVMEDILK